MYTVTITRTVGAAQARHPHDTGLQYASVDELTGALRGELTYSMKAVAHRRRRTRAGAWIQARRARRSGASAKITRGDLLAKQDQVLRAFAGLPEGRPGAWQAGAGY
jgi:hypothetical protein